MPGELQRATTEFQALLLSRDERVSTVLTQAYAPVYNKLVTDLEGVISKIKAARDSGEEISKNWLYKEARLREVIQQVERRIQEFSVAAASANIHATVSLVQDAAVRAEELIRISLGERPAQVPDEFLKFNQPTTETLIGQVRTVTPVNKLLMSLAKEQADWLRTEFVASVIRGDNPLTLSREIRDQLTVPLNRARTIARTTVLGAAREGALATYRSNPDVVKGWRWSAQLSTRTCAMCLAMHGKVFPLDVPFGSHPNCRCAPSPVTKTWEELGFNIDSSPEKFQVGQEWFDELDGTVQEQILGSLKYQYYTSKSLTLEDLIGYRVDKQWGPTRWERSLVQIIGKKYRHPQVSELERVQIP